MSSTPTPAAPPLSQDMQLLDELDALLNQRAASVTVNATQALRERLVMLCEKGMIAATPKEIEEAVANYQSKHPPTAPPEAKATLPAMTPSPVAPKRPCWYRLKAWWKARHQPPASPVAKKSKWIYERDPLVEGWRTAYLTSSTRVSLGWPYPDNHVLTLMIGNDPLRGKSVRLITPHGMFTLFGHREGTLCRFDDGRLTRVRWTDHNHSLSMQERDIKTFLTQLEKSTELHLEAPFILSSGTHHPTVTFPVAGLDWAVIPKIK